MYVVTLLQELAKTDIYLHVSNGQLKIRGPFTRAIYQTVKRHKDEILALLQLHCAGCGKEYRLGEAGDYTIEGWFCAACASGREVRNNVGGLRGDCKIKWTDLAYWRSCVFWAKQSEKRQVILDWVLTAGGKLVEGHITLPNDLPDCTSMNEMIILAKEVGLLLDPEKEHMHAEEHLRLS